MREPIVEARGLSKVYRVYTSPFDRLREWLSGRPRHREHHALSAVSFEVPAGEGLGIVGENGAGKSTLLKVLAGIVQPTTGELSVRGKVASILELGSGFHPELTGRQNISLNAAMLGLSAAETRERLPEIVAWSELGEFIDQPVKTYSTGMAMRLGFSIATQVDPEVLIIDEALSVGDGYFQKKSMDRLLALIAEGKTILFCSHAMYYVTAFCRRALWLRNGEAVALGPADEVVRKYENFLQAKAAHAPEAGPGSEAAEAPAGKLPEGGGSLPARIVSVDLPAGKHYRHQGFWRIEVEWQSEDPDLGFHLGVGVNRIDEVEVLAFGTHLDGLPPHRGQRRYRAGLEVPHLPVTKGAFTLYVFLMDEKGLHIYDRRIVPGAFEVATEGYRFGLIEAHHLWHLEAGQAGRPQPAETETPALAAASR